VSPVARESGRTTTKPLCRFADVEKRQRRFGPSSLLTEQIMGVRMSGMCTVRIPFPPVRLLPYAVVLLLLQGCASFSPPPRTANPVFLARATSQQSAEVTVSAVALTDQESDRAFGTRMAKKDVQPIWLEIDNKSNEEFSLMLIAIDPNYFSASEAAWRTRGPLEGRSWQKMEFFSDQHIPLIIQPQRKVAGYVFTNRDPGVKAFTVQLIGDRTSHHFDFAQLVPGLKTDFEQTLPSEVYAGQKLAKLDLEGLRAYLEDLPCCALGGDQKTPGDPLNIVVVGEGSHGLATFARRGWDLTETIDLGSAWRMAASSLFKSSYRTSPVSPLYLFDRPHDIALQKTRGNVDERNHLRLWKAPVTFRGTPVWVGQISRDIGVKFSSKTVVTHKIDPDVDEARAYLTQDLISSSSTGRVGYVKGVGPSTRESPRFNYTKDPYTTDGLRVVIFLSEEPTPIDEIEWLDWERLTVDYPGVVNTRSM
jgi:hypothetical protein